MKLTHICVAVGICLVAASYLPKSTESSAVDSLSKAYIADRASKIRILRELEVHQGTDEEKSAYWNKANEEARQKDYSQFLDELAKAMYEKKPGELANKLEKSR